MGRQSIRMRAKVRVRVRVLVTVGAIYFDIEIPSFPHQGMEAVGL